MKAKSLTADVLTLCFSVAAYFIYFDSIRCNNKPLLVIAAFIYFAPLFIEFIEELQNIRIEKLWVLWVFVICIVVGIVFLSVLFFYMAKMGVDNTLNSIGLFVRCILLVLPAVCIPIKVYPVVVGTMQFFRRVNAGKN